MLVRILWFTREESTSIRWCDDQPIPTGGGTVNPAPPLRAAHLVQFPPRAGTPLFPTQEEIALATACFLTASRTDLLNQALPTLRPLTRLSRRRVDHGPRLQPRAASMSVDTTESRHSRPRVGSKYLHTRVLLMGGQAKVNQKKVCQMMRRSPSREML